MKFKMSLLSFTGAFLIAIMPGNAFSQEVAVTLSQSVSDGVLANPEFEVVVSSRRATDQELRQGFAGYLPSLDFSADIGREDTSDLSTRSGSEDGETLTRSQGSLTLTQMLFDGFSTSNEVKRQKARVVSSAHRVKETAEFVGLSIVEAYLDVLRQRYLVGISDQNVRDHEDISRQIQDGVSAGRSTRADLEQARARLASAKATRANVYEALEVAQSEYAREVGVKPGQLVVPEAPYGLLAPSVDDEVVIALERSPTLKVFASDIEAAFAEAEGTKAAYMPSVDLQISGTYADDVNGVETYDRTASAVLVANWNLYRGGADVARHREFRHRHQQSKARHAEALRSVEDEVRRTWASMKAAGSRASAFAQQTKANVEVVKAYRDQFDLNRRTLLDVLDAQNELYVSQTNKVNAEFLQMFGAFRLSALRGDLFSVLGLNALNEKAFSEDQIWPVADMSVAR